MIIQYLKHKLSVNKANDRVYRDHALSLTQQARIKQQIDQDNIKHRNACKHFNSIKRKLFKLIRKQANKGNTYVEILSVRKSDTDIDLLKALIESILTNTEITVTSYDNWFSTDIAIEWGTQQDESYRQYRYRIHQAQLKRYC